MPGAGNKMVKKSHMAMPISAEYQIRIVFPPPFKDKEKNWKEKKLREKIDIYIRMWFSFKWYLLA